MSPTFPGLMNKQGESKSLASGPRAPTYRKEPGLEYSIKNHGDTYESDISQTTGPDRGKWKPQL